mmetsp:Transcript_55471/g.132562  ORF Transcript_55471/g.132562 Transcript_55471/m.132562 type:complete len:240 (-) Transcript_55471:272-991(-)
MLISQQLHRLVGQHRKHAVGLGHNPGGPGPSSEHPQLSEVLPGSVLRHFTGLAPHRRALRAAGVDACDASAHEEELPAGISAANNEVCGQVDEVRQRAHHHRDHVLLLLPEERRLEDQLAISRQPELLHQRRGEAVEGRLIQVLLPVHVLHKALVGQDSLSEVFGHLQVLQCHRGLSLLRLILRLLEVVQGRQPRDVRTNLRHEELPQDEENGVDRSFRWRQQHVAVPHRGDTEGSEVE